MSKIASNLKVLRKLKNVTQEEAAKALDITRARLGAYEEGRNEPSAELLIRFSDYYKIGIDALLRGDFEKTTPDKLMKLGSNRLLFPILVDSENNDVIEVISAKAAAGYLNGYADPEYIERMPVMNLPFKVTGKHRTFPIQGDSMPPLKSGSYVVGKYVESLDEVRSGSTYVLLTKTEGIVYKRVYVGNNKGVLELHSDNKNYQPYKIQAKDVLEIWEFVCCLNLSDKKEEEISMDSLMNMLKSMKVEIERIKKVN